MTDGQVLALLLRPDGSLDGAYTDAERTERRAQNVPFILLHHLDHARCVRARVFDAGRCTAMSIRMSF